MGRLLMVLLSVAIVVAACGRPGEPAASAVVETDTSAPTEPTFMALEPSRFCKTYGNIIDSAPEQVGGYVLIVDQPASTRDPCRGYDLFHFTDLPEAVDGIMFDDCIISWVAGGRAPAQDLGIDCVANPDANPPASDATGGGPPPAPADATPSPDTPPTPGPGE